MANKQVRRNSLKTHRKRNAHKCYFCDGYTTEKIEVILKRGSCLRVGGCKKESDRIGKRDRDAMRKMDKRNELLKEKV